MRYAGKIALITGAARGIGAAVAARLAREGASIAVLDLDAAAAEQTAAGLPLVGDARAVGLGADVSSAEQVESAVAAAAEALGGLHVLVNNAGITRDNLLFKMSVADWDSVIGVHLKGAFLASRAAQRHFVEQRYGRIVNLSSTSALGNRGQANYAAAKMGIQGFTRTLAIELGPFGVTVNAVAPGMIATEMTAATAHRLGLTVEAFADQVAANTPVGRIGRPEDVAAAIAFLGSDDAPYVTGQTLYVDGGATLG